MAFASSGRIYPKKMRKKSKTEEKLTVGQYLLRELGHASVSTLFGTREPELKRLIQISDQHDFIETSVGSLMASGFAKIKEAGCFLTTHTLLEQEAHTILRASYEHTALIAIVGVTEETIEKSAQDKSIQEELWYVSETEELETIFHKLLRSFFIATFILDDRLTAAKKIDRAIDIARYYQKPVSIEISAKMVDALLPKHVRRSTHFFQSDPESLRDACKQILKAVQAAKKPALVIGGLIHRLHAARFVIELAEKLRLPIYVTPSGRGVVDEQHPLFRGTFLKESSKQDLLLFLGTEAKEISIAKPHIFCLQEEVIINNERFPHINLYDCLHQLAIAKVTTPSKRKEPISSPVVAFQLKPEASFNKARALLLLEHFFAPNYILATRHYPNAIPLSQGSLLYSTLDPIPIGVGAAFTKPEKRLVIVSTGAEFERHCSALKMAFEHDLKPIVILFPEEEIPPFLPHMKVHTEQELFTALTAAFSTPSFSLLAAG